MKIYYKMFFIMTNILIGKYYPSIMTQVIIGVICYATAFFILKDIISVSVYHEYAYWIGSVILLDMIFVGYIYTYRSVNKPPEEIQTKIKTNLTDPISKTAPIIDPLKQAS